MNRALWLQLAISSAHTREADPDARRRELAGWAREEVLEAGATLLAEVHDIDVHAGGSDSWPNRFESLAAALHGDAAIGAVGRDVLAMTDRLDAVIGQVRAAVRGALARRDWLLSGGPLRCFICGDDIRPQEETWRVSVDPVGRAWAEHPQCWAIAAHPDADRSVEQARAEIVADDEVDAHAFEQLRTIGPRAGNGVWLDNPTRPGSGHGRYLEWTTGLADRAAAGGGIRVEGFQAFVTLDGTDWSISITDAWTDSADGQAAGGEVQ